MKVRRMLELCAGTAAALLLAAPAISAQGDFSFAGTWIGEFESEIKPEYDVATRDDPSGQRATRSDDPLGQRTTGRARALSGEGQSRCSGTWNVTVQPDGDELAGVGTVDRVCQEARGGTAQLPLERMFIEDIKWKDKGGGKDKEIEFKFRMADDRQTVCRAKGKYKPDDAVLKGEFSCRTDVRQQQSNLRIRAYNTRGKFELTRGG
jgi:hypothetical protein